MRIQGYFCNGLRVVGLVIAVSVSMTSFGCKKTTGEKVDQAVLFEKTFTEGEPDLTIEFPEEEFAQAKELRKEKKPGTAEKLLLSKLEVARKSSVGTTKLGKYLVRLNNVLFDQGNDRDAIKYGEIAQKIFYDQPLEKRPLAPWFVNIHSYLAMSYNRQLKYEEAEKHFKKAIQVSSNAPKAEVSESWMKLLYSSLADVYKAEGKKDAEMKVRERMFELYKIPIPKEPEKDKSADSKDSSKKGKKGKR